MFRKYLKILNPNISKLDEKKIFRLAKDSLINELIKKSELEKIREQNQNIL